MTVRPTRSSALDAALPERWGPLQRLKNTLIYWVIAVAMPLLLHLPLRLLRAFAAIVGAIAVRLPLADWRRAREHVALAFPDLSPREREVLVRRMVRHLALTAAEMVRADVLLAPRGPVRLDDQQRALVQAALAEGHGVVAVSGHLGNWELMAQAMAAAGFPVTGIARPLYDPRITRLVHAARTRFGMKLSWRGDSAVSKDMLRVFRQNELLAMLIDQDTKVQGVFVPFFGKLAHTPSAAAALALRFHAPIIVGWCHRTREGYRIELHRHPFAPSGDDERDVLELTAQLTRRIEDAIRQAPEQWVWLHRRWKTQPPVPAADTPDDNSAPAHRPRE